MLLILPVEAQSFLFPLRLGGKFFLLKERDSFMNGAAHGLVAHVGVTGQIAEGPVGGVFGVEIGAVFKCFRNVWIPVIPGRKDAGARRGHGPPGDSAYFRRQPSACLANDADFGVGAAKGSLVGLMGGAFFVVVGQIIRGSFVMIAQNGDERDWGQLCWLLRQQFFRAPLAAGVVGVIEFFRGGIHLRKMKRFSFFVPAHALG